MQWAGVFVLAGSFVAAGAEIDAHCTGGGVCAAADHSGNTDAGIVKLAATLRNAVPESDLRDLEALIDEVEGQMDAADMIRKRNFGYDFYENYAAGHVVTHLHHRVSKNTTDLLWQLALAADASMPAWSVRGRLSSPERLSLRCLEAIKYEVGQTAVDSDPNALSWHNDGATVFTVAVSLATAGVDFDGGDFEIRNDRDVVHRVTDIHRGDVVVWRGWEDHQVRPVSRGRRTVIVAEWWFGPTCSSLDMRPADAESYTRKAIDLDTTSIVLNGLLAEHLIKRGDRMAAEEIWTSVLSMKPSYLLGHIKIAQLRGVRGDLLGSETSLQKALKIDPQNAIVYNNLGVVRSRQGDLPGAEKMYRKAIKIDPQSADAYTHLGKIRGRQGNNVLAEKFFRKALRINPNFAEAHESLGTARAMQGNAVGAAKSFEAAIKIDPQVVSAHLNLGTVHEEQGDVVGAERCYRQALKIDPQSAKGHVHLGVARAQQNDFIGAEHNFRKAIEIDPQNTPAQDNLARLLKMKPKTKQDT
eukprot:TRINITY_DN15535_c0_g1_i3.p1 TRINITY_DN15535_c0_g1~~TRINITY_DN15535_c0_g1_i3.p1  ORF type:complete len:527 (-),score=73.53 TRINITY_DN15535_c0_g1_i3:468-2048(-)